MPTGCAQWFEARDIALAELRTQSIGDHSCLALGEFGGQVADHHGFDTQLVEEPATEVTQVVGLELTHRLE